MAPVTPLARLARRVHKARLGRLDPKVFPVRVRQRAVVYRRHLRQVRANPRGWPGARQQGLRVAKDEVGDHRSSITEASRVEGVESPQPGI